MPEFEFTQSERHFLSHWMYDACVDFWGPSLIWCWNNRIDWNHAPYPMAFLFSHEEIEAGRMGWFSERPPVPFEVPWSDSDEFWQRATAALALVPHLRGHDRFAPASLLANRGEARTRARSERR